jgi:hypothetical protein
VIRQRRRLVWTVWAALLVFYAVLGLVVLTPSAVYSGDIGVKFVQARALAAHHFRSLAIPYPGAFLDASRTFFPMRAPFVMVAGGEVQAIFPPAAAIVQAVAVGAGGFGGMAVLSILSAAATLYAASALAEPRDRIWVLVALGLGSPLWFFAISGWEHAPAVAFGTAAFVAVLKWQRAAAFWFAGVLLGAGATQRDEVVLLLPGLLLIVWLRSRSWTFVGATAAGTLMALAAAASLDVWWFHRPPAAHLRHAVHLLQSALRITSEPNPDMPVLAPFTPRQRYDTVVQYWLLGYGNDRWIAVFAGSLAAALVLRWWRRWSAGLLLFVLGIIALAAIDLHEVVIAPKWLAGMQRVSPFLAFALLPSPRGHEGRGWFHAAMLCTAGAYVLIAYAGADTAGGKALGPRLLLPLFPLLCVSAVARIRDYRSAATSMDRWIGRGGIGLLLISVAIHLCGTIPAYVQRNRIDRSAVKTVASARERVVVADDVFTAQLMFPLYYRKIVLLADTPELGRRLGACLADQHVAQAVLVSRESRPIVALPPYTLVNVEQRGRMVVEHWQR